LKGVGRIYRQTFIDTYAKVVFAKLYDRKTPITAAEILNDRVVPFYEHGIRLSRMLTDRGTEFCGSQSHEYELYLAVEDVDHSRTTTKSPQTNGICERFHRTVLDEFYRVAFRKKIYLAIEELQADLDPWLVEYNEQRPHQGRWCFGKTPMQTFLDALPMARRNSWLLDDGRIYIGSNSQQRLSGQVSTNTIYGFHSAERIEAERRCHRPGRVLASLMVPAGLFAGGALRAHPFPDDRRPAATSARTPLPAISISVVNAPIAPIVHITARPKVVNSTEVCFSTEAGPHPERRQHTELNSNIPRWWGPDRRRSEPRQSPNSRCEINMLAQIR
jgi:hypothetical protein